MATFPTAADAPGALFHIKKLQKACEAWRDAMDSRPGAGFLDGSKAVKASARQQEVILERSGASYVEVNKRPPFFRSNREKIWL